MDAELLKAIRRSENDLQGFGVNVTKFDKIYELTLFLSGGEVFKKHVKQDTMHAVIKLCEYIMDNK